MLTIHTMDRSINDAATDDALDAIPSRQRVYGDTDMDITPMIDITFLLLIFFLVASRIDDNSTIKLPQARHGMSISVTDSVVLTVIESGDGIRIHAGENVDVETMLGGADVARQNEAVTDYVLTEMTSDTPKQQVLIRASRAAKHRDVARVITAASSADDASVYIAVLEES